MDKIWGLKTNRRTESVQFISKYTELAENAESMNPVPGTE